MHWSICWCSVLAQSARGFENLLGRSGYLYALTQVRNTLFPAKSYWLSADDLYLWGSYRALWDNFIKEIQGAGIRLTDRPDALLWSHNNSHGSLSARAAYDCIVGAHSSPPVTLVDSVLWNRNLPSKISCFIWLTLRDKILTWVNLQKKGIHGPGICVLCDSNEETVEHLFIFCSVWRTVAVHVCDLLNLCTISPAASIEVMINNWIKNLPRNSPLLFLPLHMMWIIWKARNRVIFDGGKKVCLFFNPASYFYCSWLISMCC